MSSGDLTFDMNANARTNSDGAATRDGWFPSRFSAGRDVGGVQSPNFDDKNAVFGETSFFCSLLHTDPFSLRARAFAASLSAPITIFTFVILEFEHSCRLQAFRFANDRTQGYSLREANEMMAQFRKDITGGALKVAVVDWERVFAEFHRLSESFAAARGFRLPDMLHVATALVLGAETFLTFDENQSVLARAAGLTVAP
jgi:predicted nucleic acid-binding protein